MKNEDGVNLNQTRNFKGVELPLPNINPPKGRSIAIKSTIILGIILLLLIPMSIIQELVSDRSKRSQEVVKEISIRWGKDKTIVSPFILIPEISDEGKRKKDKDDEVEEVKYYRHAPSTFNVIASIDVETLNRGIYTSEVYTVDVSIEGTFDASIFKSVKSKKALFFLPVNSSDNIVGGISIEVDGQKIDEISFDGVDAIGDPFIDMSRGSNSTRNSSNTFGIEGHFEFESTLQKQIPYKITYKQTGSSSLMVATRAMQNDIKISSSWDSPSFTGDILPAKRSVTPDGFSAEWQYQNLTKVANADYKIFGVDIITPINHYQQVERSAKYAFLFIILTFMAFFIIEVTSKSRIHPIQYVLVAGALILFYTLLLSLSEHIGFNLSYFIAAFAIVMTLTAYIQTVLKSKSLTFAMGGFIATLYIFLFFVLRMEDYALLAGSILIFIALGATMYALRNVNWYGDSKN